MTPDLPGRINRIAIFRTLALERSNEFYFPVDTAHAADAGSARPIKDGGADRLRSDATQQ